MLLPQRFTKPQLAVALLFTLALSLVLMLSGLRPSNAQGSLALSAIVPSQWYPHPQAAFTLAQGFQPRMVVRPANPTNYGQRFTHDIDGNPLNNARLVVLHETVGSASSAINTIQAPQPDESKQVSYHAIISRDGTIALMVQPEFRAFGAGNSVFVGANGPETVRTHPKFPPSVNNFAYHISLETPVDGRNKANIHSGYTRAQYLSLAWLIAQTGVTEDRITTHQEVDRSGQRRDPRSFNRQFLVQILRNATG